MAITPSAGLAEADIYFNIEDEQIRDTFRQLFDNIRRLNSEVISLKERVLLLENEEDTG
jgi:hypothetical protein